MTARMTEPSDGAPRPRWYYRPWWVLLGLFVVLGPFGLPLLWKSPSFSRWSKIALPVAVAAYTILLLDAVRIAIRAAILAALEQMDEELDTSGSGTRPAEHLLQQRPHPRHDLRQQLSRRATQRVTAECGDLRLVRVHLDQVATPLVHRDRELRRRVHRRRRAGDDHAVGGLRLLEARFEDVGRDRLAERDRVALEDPVAAGTARRKLGEIDRFAGIACDALDAPDERRVTVDLEQTLAAGETMEVVDVLRDRALEDAE